MKQAAPVLYMHTVHSCTNNQMHPITEEKVTEWKHKPLYTSTALRSKHESLHPKLPKAVIVHNYKKDTECTAYPICTYREREKRDRGGEEKGGEEKERKRTIE